VDLLVILLLLSELKALGRLNVLQLRYLAQEVRRLRLRSMPTALAVEALTIPAVDAAARSTKPLLVT
jgi:hypothetical protein